MDFYNKRIHIENFIEKLSSYYEDIVLNYSYNEKEDFFDIWHDNLEYQFNNKEFLICVGKLLKEILYDNDIYNVSFGVNC